jgi:hypothetical protein
MDIRMGSIEIGVDTDRHHGDLATIYTKLSR